MNRKPTPIVAALLRRWPLPDLDGEGGKDERGRALVVGGTTQTPGAVVLSGLAALRAGAGKLQIATNREVATCLAVAMPEARVIGLASTRDGAIASRSARTILPEVDRCNALLLGPGTIEADASSELFRHRRRNGSTLVIDAGALRHLRGRKAVPSFLRGRVIATPHAGEMASLWGIERSEIASQALEVARTAAAHTGAIFVLKGRSTYVAAPDGMVFQNDAGNIGLGTSGSGDVLSGIITGLAARGAEPLQAAVWGVYLHAKAGDALAQAMGMLGFLARELLEQVPPLLARLSPHRSSPRRRRT